jgi:hypothetical protein
MALFLIDFWQDSRWLPLTPLKKDSFLEFCLGSIFSPMSVIARYFYEELETTGLILAIARVLVQRPVNFY